MPREEKSKFEPKEKKFSLVLKVEFSGGLRLKNSTFSAKLNFFSSVFLARCYLLEQVKLQNPKFTNLQVPLHAKLAQISDTRMMPGFSKNGQMLS